VLVPQGPGLGVTLDEKKLARYAEAYRASHVVNVSLGRPRDSGTRQQQDLRLTG
jgi:hypothetical protein